MHDRLHEPYRARLFPHLQILTAAARGLVPWAPVSVAPDHPSGPDPAGSHRRCRQGLGAAAASMGLAGEVETARRSGGCGDHRRERPRTRPADQLDAS